MNTDEIREEMRKHYFLDGQFDPALESYPVCRLFEALDEIDRLEKENRILLDTLNGEAQ